MSAGKASTSGAPANGLTDLAEQATVGILGPNPFVGLRVQNPTLVVEQEAALIRDLLSVMSGQSELAPPKGDKRFGDQAWQESPISYTAYTSLQL